MKKTVSRTMRYLLVLLLALFALMAFGACGEETAAEGPGISPSSTVFVKDSSHDLILTYNGELTGVKEGGNALTADQYTAEDGTLTLKEDYLVSLTRGTHSFTAVFGSKEVGFTVGCYAKPTVDPADVTYDWSDPKDLEFTVDLGGASLVSVTIEGEALKDTEYTYADGTLTITEESISRRCANGDNDCALTTDVGSVSFNIEAMTSVISFDPLLYKMQSANGEDVSFNFNAGKASWTIEELKEGAYETFAAENYTYADGKITIKASWLDTFYAGPHTFRVQANGETFVFVVGAYGKVGSAHPLDSTVNSVNNFDQYTAGVSILGADIGKDIFFKQGAEDTVVTGAEAIEGNSLKLTSKSGPGVGWNTLFGINLDFRTTATYYIALKVKVVNAKDGHSLAFRLDDTQEQYMLLLNYNAGTGGYDNTNNSNATSTFTYDQNNKILDLKMYVTPAKAGQDFRMIAINADDTDSMAVFVIDDLTVLKTDVPAGDPSVGKAEYSIAVGGNCTVPCSIPAGYRITEVKLGETNLQPEQYTFDAAGITIREAALADLAANTYPLEITLEYATDYQGTTTTKQVSGSVRVRLSGVALTSASAQQQTSDKGELSWTIINNGYTIESVTIDGETLEGTHYTYAENLYTLKKEYLDTLDIGPHNLHISFTQGGEKDAVDLIAVVYGNNSTAHLAEQVGYINFADYDEGTTLATIVKGRESYLDSWKMENKEIVADSVFGRALALPAAAEGDSSPNIGLSFRTYKADTLYVLRLTFRVQGGDPVKNLLIKYATGTEQDISWIKDGKFNSAKDFRSSLTYDSATGVYVWTSYISKHVAGSNLVVWLNPNDKVEVRQTINVGSLEFYETTLDDVTNTGSYNYLAATGDNKWVCSDTVTFSDDATPLKIVGHMNDESGKYNAFELRVGNKVLQKDVDYTATPSDMQNITLTSTFLQSIEKSVTITVCRRNSSSDIKGFDGKPFWQTASVTVTRT